MNIPSKLKNILENDQEMKVLVDDVVFSYEPIPKYNTRFFFEEYTEHGIEHIEMVLMTIENLIPEESFLYLQPREVAVLIIAVLLHDAGMYIEFSTFKAMLDGKYDDVKLNTLNEKTWYELWHDYLSKVRHFSTKEKENTFGDPKAETKEPDLSNKDNLKGVDKKLIGEFIRNYHGRFAHDVSLKGFIGDNNTILFGSKRFERYIHLAGIVARSHGENIRNTFGYLKETIGRIWRTPDEIRVVYLMVLLRLADYLHINNRTNSTSLKIRTFNSPVSLQEHKKHLAMSVLNFRDEDPELIYITCEPENAQIYVKLQDFIKDLQYEFDLSWAVLGEIYGSLFKEIPEKIPRIKYRRITSNLEEQHFLKSINYIPRLVKFKVNNELSKSLVAPLYGNDPKYGVRELVQNATDACKERMLKEHSKGNIDYEPFVEVSVTEISKEEYLFKIKDNGKGMTDYEIVHYFLSVGSSLRWTYEWKRDFISKDSYSLIKRNGKFGIGVLAAFLLGDNISVRTMSYEHNSPAYMFETSLDNDYIDIKKIDGLEPGTTIEILMSNNKYNLLTQNQPNGLTWIDWYINNVPNLRYIEKGEEKKRRKFIMSDVDNNFISKNYDKIFWGYGYYYTRNEEKNNCDEDDDIYDDVIYHEKIYGDEIYGDEIDHDEINARNSYKEKDRLFLACNDIIITIYSKVKKFQYENEKNKSQTDIDDYIIEMPAYLIVEDMNGELPLELSRNDLDTETLPFEDELLLDISKDFIAQLLLLPETISIGKKMYLEYYHTEFLFMRNGYMLNSDYFVNKISNKYILLNISTIYDSINYFSKLFELSDRHVLHFGDVNLSMGSCTFSRFKGTKPVFAWGKDGRETKWITDKYEVNSFKNYKSSSIIFDRIIGVPIMNDLGIRVNFIREIPFEGLKKIKGGRILNSLFEKYLGNNIIIPYDRQERKRYYEFAFNDLENYINKHTLNSSKTSA